jgi:hypothetical protein
LSDDDDDEDDDDVEEVHQYDWLDSMAEKGGQHGGSSLSIEGRTSQAQLLCREPEDPDLEGATVASGEGEPSGPQGSDRPEGMEES